MKLLHQPNIKTKIIDLITNKTNEEKLSFYLKTYRVWQENEKAKIRLKNLIDAAEKYTVNEEALDKVKQFLDETHIDETFWQQTQEGLAVFSTGKYIQHLIIPHEFKESWYVGEHFNVKPLVPFLEFDLEYYVLVLSQKRVLAFKGTNKVLEELDLSNVAQNINEALWMDDPEKSIQHETGKGIGLGSQGGNVYHGHGSIDNAKNENVRRFINKIEDDLYEIFENKELPLILITDEPNYSVFKEVSEYPNIYDKFVDTNPDLMNTNQIKDSVWNLISSEYDEKRAKYFERYKNNINTPMAIAQVPAVVTSAFQQRVDTLFVDASVDVWGRYNESDNTVDITETQGNGYYDLVNFSIIHTLLNGGRVFVLSHEDMPNKSPISALLRF